MKKILVFPFNVLKEIRIWWRDGTAFEKVARVFAFALLFQAAAIGFLWDIAQDNNKIGRDTNKLVEYIEIQTSPERQEETNTAVNQIIIRIDCAGARRDQLLVNGLVEQGLIDPIDVINGCKDQTQEGE